jgi:VIT1/CCC1 family predicted Fe2+/Mn2+ transporter
MEMIIYRLVTFLKRSLMSDNNRGCFTVSAEFLLYSGSLLIILWGIIHLVPTKSMLKVFGELSGDNNKIVMMEWIVEGISIISIGVLVIIVTYVAGAEKVGSKIVFLSSGTMLLILTLFSLSKISKKSTKTMWICPVIKTIVAVMYIYSMTI